MYIYIYKYKYKYKYIYILIGYALFDMNDNFYKHGTFDDLPSGKLT